MVGPGLASESTMGPLNMTRHNEIVVGLVEQARAARAEVIELGSYVDGALGASKNYLLPSLVLNPAQPWDRHRRAIRPVASDHRLGQRDRRRRSEERRLVATVLIGVVERPRARQRDRRAASHRRHLLQRPQRTLCRRTDAIRRPQRVRHRSRARSRGTARLHRDAGGGDPRQLSANLSAPRSCGESSQ